MYRLIMNLACASLLLAGCAGVVTKPNVPTLPGWVLNPPEDTASALYGVGEGSSRDTAKSAALKDVAAKLRVTISGKLENQISVHNDKVDRKAITRVSEEVQKTEFSQFTVDQTSPSEKGFYVLVKVDRQALIHDLKSRLDSLDSTIRKENAAIANMTSMERFVVLKKLSPLVDQATTLAQMLVAVGANAGMDERIAEYRRLRQESDDAASRLVFHVQANAADQDIASAVSAFLNDSGMRASTFNTDSGNRLTVRSSSRTDEIYGSKLVKLTVDLTIYDDSNRTLSSKQYTVSGASRYDSLSARRNAIQKLTESMHDAGPLAGIGF